MQKKIVALILTISLLLAFVACSSKPVVDAEPGKNIDEIIEINKKDKDVSAYLFMGIDRHGELPGPEDHVARGQNDADYLLVVNDTDKTYAVIQYNRDSMVKFRLLDANGNPTGMTDISHLCVAHSWGDGREKSCENVVYAVSNLMGGIKIDGYLSVEMDAIPVINDIIGGVTVVIEDEFSDSDPAFVKGATVKLQGEQALLFVRSRRNVGDGENPGRMRRQQQFLNEFSKMLNAELKNNSDIINKIFNAAEPYMVSSLSLGELSNIALKCNQYDSLGTFIPSGEQLYDVLYPNGKVYAEFHVDKDDVKKLVQDLSLKMIE